MNIVRDNNFVDQEVVLDYNHFKNCDFEGCTLIYHGQGDAEFSDCRIEESSFSFQGSASNTLDFLNGLRNTVFAHVTLAVAQELLGGPALRVVKIDGDKHLVLDSGEIPDHIEGEAEAVIQQLAGEDVEFSASEEEDSSGSEG